MKNLFIKFILSLTLTLSIVNFSVGIYNRFVINEPEKSVKVIEAKILWPSILVAVAFALLVQASQQAGSSGGAG